MCDWCCFFCLIDIVVCFWKVDVIFRWYKLNVRKLLCVYWWWGFWWWLCYVEFVVRYFVDVLLCGIVICVLFLLVSWVWLWKLLVFWYVGFEVCWWVCCFRLGWIGMLIVVCVLFCYVSFVFLLFFIVVCVVLILWLCICVVWCSVMVVYCCCFSVFFCFCFGLYCLLLWYLCGRIVFVFVWWDGMCVWCICEFVLLCV